MNLHLRRLLGQTIGLRSRLGGRAPEVRVEYFVTLKQIAVAARETSARRRLAAARRPSVPLTSLLSIRSDGGARRAAAWGAKVRNTSPSTTCAAVVADSVAATCALGCAVATPLRALRSATVAGLAAVPEELDTAQRAAA